METRRAIRQHGAVAMRLRELLRRAPPGAPRAYWALRSRAAAALADLHARAVARRIERALRGIAEVRFAQVGSNDGVRGDPLRRLVLDHPGWSGVFAEPVPELFARLVRNYPEEARLRFERVAVAARPGRRSVFAVAPEAEAALGGALPSWYDQIASLDAEHLVAQLGERIRPFLVAHEVECIRLEDLLARAGLERVDLLHVDAEGADYEILSQLDLEGAAPAVVLFEHAHLAADERRAAGRRLRAAGYRVSRHGGDTLALRRADTRRRSAGPGGPSAQ